MSRVSSGSGLQVLKTATTQRMRARPPLGETTYLDMFLRGKEKERLQQELAHWDRRRQKILDHLASIDADLLKLLDVAKNGETNKLPSSQGIRTPYSATPPSRPADSNSRVMTVDY